MRRDGNAFICWGRHGPGGHDHSGVHPADPGARLGRLWERPQLYARALASTGPAYEAIQNVGEAEFHRAAADQARKQLRNGLPLRAEIKLVGYLARKPE